MLKKKVAIFFLIEICTHHRNRVQATYFNFLWKEISDFYIKKQTVSGVNVC